MHTNDEASDAGESGGREVRRGCEPTVSRRSLLRGGATLAGVAVGGTSLAGTWSATAQSGDDAVFENGFESVPLGTYTPDSSEWDGHAIAGGGEQSHLSVIESGGGRVLDAVFPEGVDGAGNGNGGGDFKVGLGGVHDELYLGYRVRFDEGFEFGQPGGKLPGLIGTTGDEYAITGGDDADGENGWSARMMWRDPPDPSDGGLVEYYVYHPDKPGEYGHDMYWDDGPSGQVHFERGQWHRIEHRVVMNTPGEYDGILEGWFDGEKAFEHHEMRFRDVPELGIDELYFSTFFGGSQTEHWAHDREEHVHFDDFVVSSSPIWSGDTTAPTAPGDLQATSVGSTSVDLSWTAATDDVASGIYEYRVSVDGHQAATVPGTATEATVEGVPADTSVDLAVRAVDYAFNESDPATVTVTTDPVDDDTPPPAPPSVDVTDWYLDGVGLAWDPVEDVGEAGLGHYEVTVDGESRAEVRTGTTAHRVAGLARGTTYEFGVAAVDLAGNRSAATTVTADTLAEGGGEDALVIHDFEDAAAWPGENLLGEWAGAGGLANGGGEGEVVDGALRVEYDGNGWVKSNVARDLSSYTHLTFLIRGDQGGEEGDLEVEFGGVVADLTAVTDHAIERRISAVRVPFEALGIDGSDPVELYVRSGTNAVGAVEVEEIRFEGDEPGGGDDSGSGEDLPTVDGAVPGDLDGDGLHRDLNANGRLDSDDVVTYFEHFEDPAITDNVAAYDFNGNERIDFDDVVTLFGAL